jgi:hypothetical protein
VTKQLALNVSYDENYKEACFLAWYKAGRPKAQRVLDYLPIDTRGTIPLYSTIENWKEKYGWEQRGDAMDGQLSFVLEKEAIEKRASDLKKIAETAKKTMDLGMAYIEANGFDSASSAVRAILGGAETYAKYAGMADVLVNVGRMNDKQLNDFVENLLGKQNKYNDESLIVDADEIEEDDSPT